MDWTALWLSLRLAGFTVVLLLPLGILAGRALAYRDFRGKGLVEALVALPLVLPPTVFGYYLLVAFGAASPLGQLWQAVTGQPLVFSFEGLLLRLDHLQHPVRRPAHAARLRGHPAPGARGRRVLRHVALAGALKVELPLAWPGILTAMVLSFAHTLGEFGIVLMVGGSIPGETRTIAISIYDRVQAFDETAAAQMSALLLAISLATIALTFAFSRRIGRRLG
jgi:molybdate transport system permease protein